MLSAVKQDAGSRRVVAVAAESVSRGIVGAGWPNPAPIHTFIDGIGPLLVPGVELLVHCPDAPPDLAPAVAPAPPDPVWGDVLTRGKVTQGLADVASLVEALARGHATEFNGRALQPGAVVTVGSERRLSRRLCATLHEPGNRRLHARWKATEAIDAATWIGDQLSAVRGWAGLVLLVLDGECLELAEVDPKLSLDPAELASTRNVAVAVIG